ncbi:MAG TPA: hypothetical protein PKA53_12535 [Sphingobacterium sp.]|nr:hypothetical protein [Sphingobacterium sp.]
MKRIVVHEGEHHSFSDESSNIIAFLNLLKEQEVRLSFRENCVPGSLGTDRYPYSGSQIIKILKNEIELRLKLYE